ncbi:hypothetical protein [Sulfurimonas sp.]
MKKILFFLFLVVSANALNLTRPSCLSNYHVTFTDSGTNTYYLAEDNPPHKDFYDYPSTCSDGITGYFNSYIKTYSNGNVNVSQHRQTWSSCPSGQVLDENDYTQCVAPTPTCSDGYVLDSNNECVLDPNGDLDSDGILNSQDNDLDGDGIPNIYDDIIGLGTSNGSSDGSFDESLTCGKLQEAALLKCPLPDNVLKFSCYTTNEGLSFVTQNDCFQREDPCAKIKSDFASKCSSPRVVNGDCVSKDYKIVSNTLSCDTPDPINSACDIAFDNIKSSCNPPSYIDGKCLDGYGEIISNTLHCVDIADSNGSSSSDSSNVKDSIDSLNKNLSSNIDKIINHLKPIESNTLNSSDSLKSIDSKLSTLISNSSDKTELNSINQMLGLGNSKLDKIVSNTSETVKALNIANSNLNNIDNSIKDIKNLSGSFSDGVSSVNTDDIGIDTSSLDDTSTIMDNLEDNLAYLTDDVTSIKDKFTDLKNLLEGDQTKLSIPTGGCSNENLNKFASYIAPYSSIFALVTYVSFMIQIFSLIFKYMSRGE